jgi:hypothetical protein
MVPRGLTIVVMAAWASAATAATVRGTVMLPAEPRAGDRDAHWRVENGVLPVGPRVPDPRLDVIVVLEGASNTKAQLPNATVTLHRASSPCLSADRSISRTTIACRIRSMSRERQR